METLKVIVTAGFYAVNFLLTYTKAIIDRAFPRQKIKIISGLSLYIIFITTLNTPPSKTKELHKVEFKFPPPPQLPAFVNASR